MHNIAKTKPGERGQTIILVAISIVSLLAMAALAIDVITLYVARTEIQRAADAAALAGAQGIADSGVTTLQPQNFDITAQNLATKMANDRISAMLPTNLVAGNIPELVTTPVIDFTTKGNSNPLVTINLRQYNLPTFFAKIWGKNASTVSAAAIAEAYNPSNNPSYTLIAPKVVKPWLVANLDPYNVTTKLVDPGTGATDDGIIGNNPARPFYLTVLNSVNRNTVPTSLKDGHVQYVPALVTADNGQNVCGKCAAGLDFERSIACADVTTTYSCGVNSITVDQVTNPGGINGPSASGAECLIHASSFGSAGQDIINFPFPSGPPQITTYTGTYSGSNVSTSSSIVTLPIVDQTRWGMAFPSENIVGFMQAFIREVEGTATGQGAAGDINITVLNIAGCGGTPNGHSPVVGGSGTSPVPVRLISSP